MQLNEYKSQNQNLYSVNSIILINHTFMTLNKAGDYIHTCVNMYENIKKIDLVGDSLDFYFYSQEISHT